MIALRFQHHSRDDDNIGIFGSNNQKWVQWAVFCQKQCWRCGRQTGSIFNLYPGYDTHAIPRVMMGVLGSTNLTEVQSMISPLGLIFISNMAAAKLEIVLLVSNFFFFLVAVKHQHMLHWVGRSRKCGCSLGLLNNRICLSWLGAFACFSVFGAQCASGFVPEI